MSATKVCSADEAAALVGDRSSVVSTGVIGWSTPDLLLSAIGARHERTGAPRDLTVFFPVATGDALGIPGMEHVARQGLLRRIVAGSFINPVHPDTGLRPALMRLIQEDAVEAYSWPIGATMHWLREVARRSPGYLTRVGIGTYIDPRQQGGRLTPSASEDLVEIVSFRGEELLFYPSWPLDVALIRASASDDDGNLSFERDPLISSAIAAAMAVKACGGTVLAQVAELVPRGTRTAHDVRVPACFVDHVVVDEAQMMTTDVQFDPAYLGFVPDALGGLSRLDDGADKVIARRVAREVRPHEPTIFGFGASSDVPLVMAEDGLLDADTVHDYHLITEHGAFGGVVMSGWQFSANLCPVALVDGVSQFDFIDGGGCKTAVLSFAQFDAAGNVNVSKFGAANPGAGGFIDIAHNAQRLIFAGTLTTNGLRVATGDGRLRIEREGRIDKLVPVVDQITYDVARGVAAGQHALVVTERAVFEVTTNGLVLIEIAPGVDVETDVRQRVGFSIDVRDPLVVMHRSLFGGEDLGAATAGVDAG